MNRLAYYLIIIEGNQHEIRGPYNKRTRDHMAKMFLAKSLHCRMFGLDIIDGHASLQEMSIEFFRAGNKP